MASCNILAAQNGCLALVTDLWVASPLGPSTLSGLSHQPPPLSCDGTSRLLGSGVGPWAASLAWLATPVAKLLQQAVFWRVGHGVAG